MLNDKEFWERIKKLDTVPTLVQNKPLKIIKVDQTHVTIFGRTSRISFFGEWGLYTNYHKLHQYGRITPGDENTSAYAATMAIIYAAVPEEVNVDGKGLRLRASTWEQLQERLEHLKTTLTALQRLFPNGIPADFDENVSVEQKEAHEKFNEAWEAVLKYRVVHPNL
jgi:hypothetical protein